MNNGSKKELGVTRIIGLIATALMVISFFLPFVKASALGLSAQANLMSQDGGAAMLIFAAVALLVTIVGKPKVIIAGGIFDCVVMIIAIVYAMGQVHGASVKLLTGFWLYILASVLLIAAGIYGVLRNRQR